MADFAAYNVMGLVARKMKEKQNFNYCLVSCVNLQEEREREREKWKIEGKEVRCVYILLTPF